MLDLPKWILAWVASSLGFLNLAKVDSEKESIPAGSLLLNSLISSSLSRWLSQKRLPSGFTGENAYH